MRSKKSNERRLFYWQLGRELCTRFVKNCSHNPQIMILQRKWRLKVFFCRAINPNVQPTTSEYSKPQAQFDSTGKKRLLGYAMFVSPANLKNVAKLKNSVRCEFPICNEHCISNTTCEVYMK